MAERTQRRVVAFAATLGLALTVGLVVTAAPAAADLSVDDTTQCVAGTFHVGHGVTQVHVHAIGAAGEDGTDVTQNIAGGTEDWPGGTGGRGSDVETTIPVTAARRSTSASPTTGCRAARVLRSRRAAARAARRRGSPTRIRG